MKNYGLGKVDQRSPASAVHTGFVFFFARRLEQALGNCVGVASTHVSHCPAAAGLSSAQHRAFGDTSAGDSVRMLRGQFEWV
jgi:hypothetical protein